MNASLCLPSRERCQRLPCPGVAPLIQQPSPGPQFSHPPAIFQRQGTCDLRRGGLSNGWTVPVASRCFLNLASALSSYLSLYWPSSVMTSVKTVVLLFPCAGNLYLLDNHFLPPAVPGTMLSVQMIKEAHHQPSLSPPAHPGPS